MFVNAAVTGLKMAGNSDGDGGSVVMDAND